MEDEESKKIAVAVNNADRKAALDHCAQLGFTLGNTPGVDEIKPLFKGMKGIGKSRNTSKSGANKKRVDLDEVPNHVQTNYIPTGVLGNSEEQEEFIKLDVGESQEYESMQNNGKLTRKIRRAINDAQLRKELLVRQRALNHYAGKSERPPAVLLTPPKPFNLAGRRILENGALETANQERVRKRKEDSEKVRAARVLRKQAKQVAREAALRKHAELTGRLPSRGLPVNGEEKVEIQGPSGFSGTSNVEGFMLVKPAKPGKIGALDCRAEDGTVQ